MENLTPNTFNIIPASEEIIVPEISEDGLGATLGIGGRPISTINQAINQEGNFVNELINDKLDTDAKEILGDFTFGASGAIKMITDANNGLWISPTGILAKKAGANTLTVTTAGDVTMVGTITASAGSIGGFTIGASDLSVTSGGNTTIVSSGATAFTAGPTGAPTVTITQAGVITAAGATITGSTISTPTITNIQSGSEISIQGWKFDGAFSITDANTVAWGSGTLTLLDGTTFSIDAGNTGDMSATTYIYFSKNDSETVLQTSTTASDAVGTNKILICVAKNSTSEALFRVMDDITINVTGDDIEANSITANQITAGTITATEIAVNTITANEIAANTITASEIAASTITATEINVSQLSAITGNMGTITSGTMTVTGSADAITIPNGGNILCQAGGDIYLTADDSNPSEIRFRDASTPTEYITFNFGKPTNNEFYIDPATGYTDANFGVGTNVPFEDMQFHAIAGIGIYGNKSASVDGLALMAGGKTTDYVDVLVDKNHLVVRDSSVLASAVLFEVEDNSSVILGKPVALATNATDGFLYIPTSAGAPTGTPTSHTGKVALEYDTTNNDLYIYNGAWKKVALA